MIEKDYTDVLQDVGLKHTKARVEIMDLIHSSDKLLSAQDIYTMLKRNKYHINLSTVYRTLEKLIDSKLINKISLDNDNQAVYEYNKHEHHHLIICQKCNKVIAVYNCPIKDYQEELEAQTGFKVIGHKVEFYGYCEKCKRLLD